jgi:hypothetical protein
MKTELKNEIINELVEANIKLRSSKSKLPQIIYFELKNAKKGLPLGKNNTYPIKINFGNLSKEESVKTLKKHT